MRKICRLVLPIVLLCSGYVHAQLQMTAHNGWEAFELLTQGDDISSISEPGYGTVATRGRYDGLGIFQTGPNSLMVWINHENEPAVISYLELDRSKLRQAVVSTINNGTTSFPTGIKTGIGFAYDAIYDSSFDANSNPDPVAAGTTEIVNYSNANFDRFCSGTSYVPNSFGVDRGFVDFIYITGEEVSGGKFYALDEVNRDLWEIPSFGTGNWENAALVDTGNTTHVALLLSSDISSSPGDYLRMYVGEKNIDANGDSSIDFLERNGMRGGTVYYFVPDAGFSTTDLPDGQVTGTWSISTSGALRETKLEDVHTNPLDGNQAVFSDQTDGVYVLQQTLVFDGSNLDLANSLVSIDQIDDRDISPVGAPDNLVWSTDGMIYVQEDGDGQGMFQMNNDGTGLLQFATAFSEPSGIIDASAYVGHQPGSVFLSSIQGSGTANAQLVVIVSPAAVEPMIVPVDSVAVVSGIQSGGSVADLVESDDVDLSILRNSLQTAGIVEVEVKAFSPVTNPAFFEITVESSAFYRSSVVQSVTLFDFEAGVYVEVDSRTASRFSDGVAAGSATGDLSRFVEAGTSCITARIIYLSSVQRQAFSVAIDQIFWTVQ